MQMIWVKMFLPCPVLCNKNITCIHLKKLQSRSSCPDQSSIIEKEKIYSHVKKFRANWFLRTAQQGLTKIFLKLLEQRRGERRERERERGEKEVHCHQLNFYLYVNDIFLWRNGQGVDFFALNFLYTYILNDDQQWSLQLSHL